MKATPCLLPAESLLHSYRAKGDFVDCYGLQVTGQISLSQFVNAFYTTRLFRLERLILRWLVAKPSTDAEASELANGLRGSFAAWRVEARNDQQLLMCDFQQQTRSWFMVDQANVPGQTALYFGSVVVGQIDKPSGKRVMSKGFKALLGFHNLYSKALLNASSRALTQTTS